MGAPEVTVVNLGRASREISQVGAVDEPPPLRQQPPEHGQARDGEAWGILMIRKRTTRLPSRMRVTAPSVKGGLPPTSTRHRGSSVPPPRVSRPTRQSCPRV